MANSLPGCPIVGFYNKDKQDFEEHNRIIDLSDGKFEIIDTTRPYGFVDLNAKVWFEKFLDDDEHEQEYLVTEGWLWTGAYPECKRILEHGNNQSMELDNDSIDASWTKNDKGDPEFFIINEALISKLCILGENNEPCFEGSTITKFSLVFPQGFKEEFAEMINELKTYLKKEGGAKVFIVQEGDSVFTEVQSHILNTYGEQYTYQIYGFYEENEQKYVVFQKMEDNKYYRLNFSILEDNSYTFVDELIEVDVSSLEPQFKKKENDEEEKKEETEKKPFPPKKQEDNDEENSEEDEKDKKKKKKFSLELEEERKILIDKFNALEEKYTHLESKYCALKEQNISLLAFKAKVERKEKEAMIAQFYMLSDEDKKDVVENIDTYSLEDIESKLSVICVRNKVSFDKPEESTLPVGETTFSLTANDNDNVPAWVKAALETAQEMKDN